jgi:hypothetical protein
MQAILYNRAVLLRRGQGLCSLRENFGSLIPEIMAIFPAAFHPDRDEAGRLRSRPQDPLVPGDHRQRAVHEFDENTVCRPATKAPFSLTVSAKDGRLLFIIYEDNGPGIPENVSPRTLPVFG